MKKVLIVLGILIMSLSFNSCELLDDMKCEDNKDPISVTIVPNVAIFDYDQRILPYYNFNYKIHKVYCDGRIAGEFQGNYTTNGYGKITIPYQMTYNMKNSEDKVILEFRGGQTDDGWLLDEKFTLYYNDLVDYDKTTLYLVCYLTLNEEE